VGAWSDCLRMSKDTFDGVCTVSPLLFFGEQKLIIRLYCLVSFSVLDSQSQFPFSFSCFALLCLLLLLLSVV